jgi:hypothetical protein
MDFYFYAGLVALKVGVWDSRETQRVALGWFSPFGLQRQLQLIIDDNYRLL